MFPKCVLSALLDLRNALHCLDRRLHQFSVVAYRDVATFLEVNCRVLKCFIQYTSTQKKQLQLTIVISFPAALRNAFVHRTFRGLRFILLDVSIVPKIIRQIISLEVLVASGGQSVFAYLPYMEVRTLMCRT